MRSILFIIIFSFYYSNFSYQGLLLPNSTDELVSGHSHYLIFKDFLSNNKVKIFIVCNADYSFVKRIFQHYQLNPLSHLIYNLHY